MTAEPDKRAPEPAVVQKCGTDLKQHAETLAATGKPGTATCIRKQARKADRVTTGAGVAADICGGRPTLTRTAACVIEDGVLLVFTVPNGAVIGSIRFTVSSLTTLDYASITAPAVHRCDDALTGYPSGCVHDSVRPVHDVLSSRYPSYARHLQLAINPFTMTDILTRTQNETIIDRTYNTACPPGHPKPTAPGVWSCDEYPYQSTYNGAYSQPYGRTL